MLLMPVISDYRCSSPRGLLARTVLPCEGVLPGGTLSLGHTSSGGIVLSSRMLIIGGISEVGHSG